ncbi:uncharacterized protein LOC144433103 [Glandiceps talaboti]
MDESKMHINALELLAIEFALRAFMSKIKHHHVKVLSDNTTAVSYVVNMGRIKSDQCNRIGVDIWKFCIDNDIWLSCSHIAGRDNTEADRASRHFDHQLEWKLNENIFRKICKQWNTPDIDLFASRLNAQIDNYVSWRPDPNASYVNAFTIDWGKFNNVYLFPPSVYWDAAYRKSERTEQWALL